MCIDLSDMELREFSKIASMDDEMAKMAIIGKMIGLGLKGALKASKVGWKALTPFPKAKGALGAASRIGNLPGSVAKAGLVIAPFSAVATATKPQRIRSIPMGGGRFVRVNV